MRMASRRLLVAHTPVRPPEFSSRAAIHPSMLSVRRAVTVPSAAPCLPAKKMSSAGLPEVPLWLSVPPANPYLKGFKAGPHPLVSQAGHPAPELLLVVEIEGAHHRGVVVARGAGMEEGH